MTDTHECRDCGDDVNPQRWALGRYTCLACGDKQATQERKGWCVAPMPKSNYMLFTDITLLKGLNTSHKGSNHA